jgi:hypothetical protein
MRYNQACRRCLQTQGILADISEMNSYATVLHGKTALENALVVEQSLRPLFSVWCTKCEKLSVNLSPLFIGQTEHSPAAIAAYLTHVTFTLGNDNSE